MIKCLSNGGVIVDFSKLDNVNTSSSFTKLAFATILVGLCAGLIGTILILLMRLLEQFAYGHIPISSLMHANFLEAVLSASPVRRVSVLMVCGLIAGIGWWGIYRYGGKLINIETVVNSDKPKIPVFTTLADSFLQLITVSLGSPLGREVAHRKISLVFSGWILSKSGLTLRETKIMLACGAGAGFAAGYNIPLGGAMFTLEVLLGSYRWPTIIPAFGTSIIAVATTWLTFGNTTQFHLPPYTLSYSLLVWSIIIGPIFGVSAYWFNYVNHTLSKKITPNWQVPIFCLISFTLVGIVSIPFPSLPGNGRGLAQIGFDYSMSLGMIGLLLLLRLLITWLVLRAGARGGILTPSIVNGALLGAILGGVWSMFWPVASSLGAFALVGAGAFLAAARSMPLTALILMLELTGMHLIFLIPVTLAVVGSVSFYNLCVKKYSVIERHRICDEV